ncbi:MAG: 4-oxalocrotonate tautomerase [Chloroflexi bacterium]|nr:MAG: 4-oxalocrotonate tautomerase [Chloroflexota bacterium]
MKELSVGQQRYKAVIAVLSGGRTVTEVAREGDVSRQTLQMNILNYGEESVSVAIEEVSSKSWAEKVYKPKILDNSDKLYKKPGYTM